MKMAFVYTLYETERSDRPLTAWTKMNFGIAYLSSFLKSHGHATCLLVLSSRRPAAALRRLTAFVRENQPDVIGFSAVASQYSFACLLARACKQRWPSTFVLIGGVHVTLDPESAIGDAFDGVCVGEGEEACLELCRQLSRGRWPSGIANLWLKSRDGTIERNPPRPFLDDLDVLPFPDRDLWAPWISEQTPGDVALLLGRGCPFPCTYCCNHALRRVASGRYVRRRSPENIVREIAYLRRRFPGQTAFHLEMESIALDRDWLLGLCKSLEAFNATCARPPSYDGNFRVCEKPADAAIFAAFRAANVRILNLGLEAGSERVRREILKRHYSNAEFLRTVALARQHGIKIRTFNMVGLPGETMREHMETVALNRAIQPDEYYSGIFFPYPGTDLHRLCVEKGWLRTVSSAHKERTAAFVDLPGFSRAQVQAAHDWFAFRVYRGFRPWWWLLDRTVAARAGRSPILHGALGLARRIPLLRHLRQALS